MRTLTAIFFILGISAAYCSIIPGLGLGGVIAPGIITPSASSAIAGPGGAIASSQSVLGSATAAASSLGLGLGVVPGIGIRGIGLGLGHI